MIKYGEICVDYSDHSINGETGDLCAILACIVHRRVFLKPSPSPLEYLVYKISSIPVVMQTLIKTCINNSSIRLINQSE